MNFIKEVFVPYEQSQLLKKKLPGIFTENEFELFQASTYYGNLFRNCMDANTLAALADFKNNPYTTALLLRGLPTVAPLPQTPYGVHANLFDIALAAATNIALYDALGIFPVTYKGENDGRLFRDIVPKKNSQHEKSSYGSSYTLGMHVDNCHLPLVPECTRQGLSIAPEYLSLYGLRCDLRVPTKIACLDEVMKKLDSATIATLKEPLYELTMPDSFSSHEKFTLPIFVQDQDGVFYSRFDKEYTKPLNAEATTAFQKFEQALYEKDSVHHFFLQNGDFLIFKNQRMTHSREAFQARYDGTDRWLIRLFGVNNLDRTIPVNTDIPYCIKAC